MLEALSYSLIVISLLLWVYIHVWSRGPRDGKLCKAIRGLTHARNVWRKRALRDEKLLSRLIDKRYLYDK